MRHVHAAASALSLALWLVAPLAAQNEERVDALLLRAEEATKAKQHAKAMQLLRYAWSLDSRRPDTREAFAGACLRVGVDFLEKRQAQRALDAFRQGKAVDPKNFGIWLGIAQCSRSLRRHDEAERALRTAVAIRPKSVAALLSLGELLFERRRYKAAIPFFERVLRLQPKNRSAKTLLARARSDAGVEQGFRDTASRNFVVRYNGKRARLERYTPKILEFLETTHVELAETLAHRPKDPICVILYTRTEFAKLRRTADWVGAFYDGKVRIPLDSWPTQRGLVKRTIRHELCHAFLQTMCNRLSPWLHEGFAQWFERKSSARAIGILRKSGLVSIKALRTNFMATRDPKVASRLYAQSLMLFDELHQRRGLAGLRALLAELGAERGAKRSSEDEALKKTYGYALDGLLEQIARAHRLSHRAPARGK